GTAEPGAEPSGSVVLVDFRRLDTLLEVLGEGLIEHSALVEAYRRVARRSEAVEGLGDLDRTIVALEKTMKRLEAVVMGIRLLPISTVFGRFPRLLRDIAHGEGKRVRLAVSGGETALDKAVLDRLGEPLLHLLNNAVVHGIETPEERRAGGKPPEAALELSAVSHSGRVVIRLSDDGRGLDEARILAKAEALGLEVRSADPEQIRSLIFLPGFSTAAEVSQLAGRGVGLDVVATSIRGLGGTIDVESQPGRGVTFVLNLPLTLAIVRSLIVEVDQERYAVPISHVAETVRAEPEAIHEINRRGVALWRGDLIHVSDGGALLGTASSPIKARRFFIVISSGGKRRGVMVDRLVGHQDVVVKGLDPTLGRPEVVSGTTILGDGRVACILDAVRILDQRIPA
ncbi:MAG: chemotaxis protein CheA, partial [Gemmatimonadales bacterium]